MILEELTRLSSNLCNALSMISPRSFSASETSMQDDPERVHEDPEVKQAVQVLDKLISVAKQCQKALQPLVYRSSDCSKIFPETQALHIQQTQLDNIEPPSYLHTDFATKSSPNFSVVSCDDDDSRLASFFQVSKQLLIQQQESLEEDVNHDGSVEEEESLNLESKVVPPSLEPQDQAARRKLAQLSRRAVNLQSSNEEEDVEMSLLHHQSAEVVKLLQIDNVDYSAETEAETQYVKDPEVYAAAEQEDPLKKSKEVLEESEFQMTGFLQGSLEKLEISDGFWYPTPSLKELQMHSFDFSKTKATAAAEDLDHESLEGEFWSPSATLQDLDMSTAFFQTSLREEEVEYEAAVEETELPYPSDLFEEIHTSDGLILGEEPLKWEHELLLTQQKHGLLSSDSDALEEDTEIDLIPRTYPWKKQTHDFGASRGVWTYPVQSSKEELEFHDMGLAGLESLTNLGDRRALMEEPTPKLRHNALGSWKDLQVDHDHDHDHACHIASTMSEKAGIRFSVMEEVRKTLKEYAQESLRELKVHDICCARQKRLEAEFKPLMEELVVDSFAEFPSPSSSSDENPSAEFSEDHQPMVTATTETTTTCKPVNQATSKQHSCATILLPRTSSSDTKALDELHEQQQVSLKTAIDVDSQHLRMQALEEQPSSDKEESNPVYTYPELVCDDTLDSVVPLKQPQLSSKVVTDKDILQSSKVETGWDFLQSLKVISDRDSLQLSNKVQTLEPANDRINSSGEFKNSTELHYGSSDSEFVHESLDNSELSKMQTLVLTEMQSRDAEQQQYHDDDMVFSELQNSQQVDLWEPCVEEDGIASRALALDFLFPRPHFKHEVSVSFEEDKKETTVLTKSLRVPALTLTPHQNQLAVCGSQNQELTLSSRAPKSGLRQLTGGVTSELAKRSKRTVTFVDEAQTDDEDTFFPSLKSWEVPDDELQPMISNEPQKPISSKYKQQAEADKPPKLISSKHKHHQVEADKLLVLHETPVPQSHNHRTSTAKTSAIVSSDCFPSSKTGVMVQHMISRSGRIFTYPRSLLPFKGGGNKGSRTRIRPSNSWVTPKETSFGGSARTDAEQIKRILRASHKTFAELTTSDFLSQELD
ncbi:unnamed protein product [Sphagnum jensenii]|uniref:Uncharacterized protein n=1 Tax=Sphagnum jensenii TaxID=128206 RepID=A0ABP1ANJ8_9BRYO